MLAVRDAYIIGEHQSRVLPQQRRMNGGLPEARNERVPVEGEQTLPHVRHVHPGQVRVRAALARRKIVAVFALERRPVDPVLRESIDNRPADRCNAVPFPCEGADDLRQPVAWSSVTTAKRPRAATRAAVRSAGSEASGGNPNRRTSGKSRSIRRLTASFSRSATITS